MFILDEASRRGALRLRQSPEAPLLSLDAALSLVRGQLELDSPVVLVPSEGKTPYDYIGVEWSMVPIVSERFTRALEGIGATGWRRYPVEVLDRDDKRIPGYHGFAVTGRSGPIDNSLSERIIIPPPVPNGRSAPGLRGYFFHPETWDGSDVFMPEGTQAVLLTRRARHCLEEAGLSNVAFESIAEVTRLIVE